MFEHLVLNLSHSILTFMLLSAGKPRYRSEIEMRREQARQHSIDPLKAKIEKQKELS